MKFGSFELDPQAYELRSAGQTVKLERIPMELLLLLAASQGKLITREEIVTHIWGKDHFLDSESAINTAIRKLRNALGEDPEHPQFIQTIPRKGYRFASHLIEPAPEQEVAVRSEIRGALLETQSEATLATLKLRTPDSPSIAVLPFVNISGDKEQDYFCDGLAEEVLNTLARYAGLRVIARTSSFAFKGRNVDVRRIAAELAVSHVLEGSVRRASDRIRVTAQLVSAEDGSQIWSERYDREFADVFAVQGDIAQAIADTLKVRLFKTGPQSVKRYTSNLEVHNLYLRGAFHISRMAPEDQSKGRQLLESVVVLEPGHASAWVELVLTYYSRAIQASAFPQDELAKALDAARHSSAADESLAEAHGALGFIRGCYQYDWTAAMTSLRRGLALNPESSRVHFWYAALLLILGSIEEALVEFEKARHTDPLSALVNMCVAFVYSQAGRYDLSIERSRQALEIVPDFYLAFASLGEAYSWQGKHNEALEWLEKARPRLAGDFWPTGSLGKAYVRAGRRLDAEGLLAELQAKRREGRYVAAEAIAAIATALEDYDLAFEWLETAVTERDPQLTWQLRTDPTLAPIRADPRYRSILRRMNLSTL